MTTIHFREFLCLTEHALLFVSEQISIQQELHALFTAF